MTLDEAGFWVGKMGNLKNLLFPALFTAAFVSVTFFLLGVIPAIMFTLAFGGRFFLYMATIWGRQFDRRKITPFPI